MTLTLLLQFLELLNLVSLVDQLLGHLVLLLRGEGSEGGHYSDLLVYHLEIHWLNRLLEDKRRRMMRELGVDLKVVVGGERPLDEELGLVLLHLRIT